MASRGQRPLTLTLSPSTGRGDKSHRRAFTLIELMISIALSLLLILAINTIFKLSSDAVGTGYQLSSMNRQFRFMSDAINTDMLNMADYQTQPALIIQCMNTPAFRDKTDMAAEPNYTTGNTAIDGMMEITQPGTTNKSLYPLSGTTYPTWLTAGITTAANLYKVRYEICDDRNHRTDIFSFFANNDTFRRQTGALANGLSMESDFTSQEAYIWYGHVLLPNNFAGTALTPASKAFYIPTSTTPYTPSGNQYTLGINPDTTIPSTITAVNNDPSNNGNPNNFFASQWVLGRMAVLMTAPPTTPPAPAVLPYTSPYTKAPQPQNYLVDTHNTSLATPVYYLTPLGYTTQSNDIPTPTLPTAPFVYNSLCDLAGSTLANFRSTTLAAEYQTATPADDWYLPLISQFAGTPTTPYNADQTFRFWAKPWPNKSVAYGQQNTTGLITQEIARTIPVFTRGCSQFIVEFAGDYLKQDVNPTTGAPSGAVAGVATDVGEDGQIDYDVVPNPNVPGSSYKRIRWYGLTRSLDGGVTVEDATGSGAAVGNPPTNTEIVRPLWRYIQQLQTVAGTLPATSGFNHLPFEKIGIAGTPTPITPHGSGGAGFPSNSYPGGASTSYQTGYTCAWAPDDIDLDNSQRPAGDAFHNMLGKNPANNKYYFPSRSLLPWLIRITVRLDDPNGRLPQGQQMQFIFKVNRPH